MPARRISALAYCSFLSWNVVKFFAGTVPCTAGWGRGASGRGRCGNPWIVLEINLFWHGNQDGGEYSKIAGKRLWRARKRKDHNMGGQLPGHEFNKIGTWESELQIIHNTTINIWKPQKNVIYHLISTYLHLGQVPGQALRYSLTIPNCESLPLTCFRQFEQLVGRHCSDLLVKKDFPKNTISF